MKAQWIEVERFDENFIFQSFEIQNLTAASQQEPRKRPPYLNWGGSKSILEGLSSQCIH